VKPVSNVFFGENGPRIIFHNGTSIVEGYIVSQIGLKRYRVTVDGSEVYTVVLATGVTDANNLTAGQATLVATPFGGSASFVDEWKHIVRLADGTSYDWTIGDAAAGLAKFTMVDDASSLFTPWWNGDQVLDIDFAYNRYMLDGAPLTLTQVVPQTFHHAARVDEVGLVLPGDSNWVQLGTEVAASLSNASRRSFQFRIVVPNEDTDMLVCMISSSNGMHRIHLKVTSDAVEGFDGIELTIYNDNLETDATLSAPFQWGTSAVHYVAFTIDGTHAALAVDGGSVETSENVPVLGTLTTATLAAPANEGSGGDITFYGFRQYPTLSDQETENLAAD